jgi:poly-gamma-glutamate capsule biosynthesis protein CapA/YwtB (metallophosphatase superfamily)
LHAAKSVFPGKKVSFVTITRVGTNHKYSNGWDIAFGGKKGTKSAAAKATPAKAAQKKGAPKKKTAAPKKKAKK